MSAGTRVQKTASQREVAFAPETFEQLSQIWRQKMADHLSRVGAGDGPVLNWINPETAIREAESLLTEDADSSDEDLAGRFGGLVEKMLASGQNLHHPRYIGHQVPASVPTAALFDAIGTVTNQPMAIYEMGPWATAVEHALVRTMCRQVGWDPDSSSGLLTSGGSLANLTALLTARNVTFPDSWEHGPPASAVIFAHADAHYCVTRAAGVLGLGTSRIRKAALDARRRIDPGRLDDAIQRERSAGRTVMAVAAAACATPIGAFDPLTEIAEVCQKHHVWMHVDAAHGGGVLMSRAHRHLLNGAELADSMVWDAHKMMFVPALCAAVLYRHKANCFAAFQQDAPYLFDPTNPGMAEFDNGLRTVECTKRSLGFGLWGLWSMFGATLFEQLIDHTFDLAAFLYDQLQQASDFEPLHVPQCNIVAFRHLPEDLAKAPLSQQNQFQQQVRAAVVRSGEFYLVQTSIDGSAALRVTIMNPNTTRDDIESLLQAIRAAGRRLTSGATPA